MRKPPLKATPELMYRAAQLFYNENLTKSEIAAALNSNIKAVTNLLEFAREQGVVTIKVSRVSQGDLENRLKSRYPHLLRVGVVPGSKIDSIDKCDDFFKRAGVLAARYFEELHEKHPRARAFRIGVTGGERLIGMANAVSSMHRDNARIHALALIGRGRLGEAYSHVEPSVAASILWTHCGSLPGHCEYETVEPYRLSTGPGPKARTLVAAELERLHATSSIKSILRELEDLDVAFAGFGKLNPKSSPAYDNRIGMSSLVKNIVSLEQLVKEGATGDFGYCPFDAEGIGTPEHDWNFFLTAGHGSSHPGIEFYKNMVASKKVVAGIGGPNLLPIIKTALDHRIVNALFIDEFTASQLAKGY